MKYKKKKFIMKRYIEMVLILVNMDIYYFAFL